MLLSSNMENVSKGPLLINHQRCTSSRRYLYSAQKNAQKSAYGIPYAEIAVYLTVSLGEVTTTLSSFGAYEDLINMSGSH